MRRELTDFQRKIERIMNGEQVLTEADRDKADRLFCVEQRTRLCENTDVNQIMRNIKAMVYYHLQRNELDKARQAFKKFYDEFDKDDFWEKNKNNLVAYLSVKGKVNWFVSLRKKSLVLMSEDSTLPEKPVSKDEIIKIKQQLRMHVRDTVIKPCVEHRLSRLRQWIELYGSANKLDYKYGQIDWDSSARENKLVLYPKELWKTKRPDGRPYRAL